MGDTEQKMFSIAGHYYPIAQDTKIILELKPVLIYVKEKMTTYIHGLFPHSYIHADAPAIPQIWEGSMTRDICGCKPQRYPHFLG